MICLQEVARPYGPDGELARLPTSSTTMSSCLGSISIESAKTSCSPHSHTYTHLLLISETKFSMPSAVDAPTAPLQDEDEKDLNPLALTATHDEEPVKGGLVDDSEAKDYVHPGLEISEEESKRLRRKIHRRYAFSLF